MSMVSGLPQVFSRVKAASVREPMIRTTLFMYKEGIKVKAQAESPKITLRTESAR
jgi:hypothetical protein